VQTILELFTCTAFALVRGSLLVQNLDLKTAYTALEDRQVGILEALPIKHCPPLLYTEPNSYPVWLMD
jgi:hypothetical protein